MALNIDVGKIKFTWKGTYDAATTYEKDDVVHYGGDSWICVIGPDTYGNAQTVTGTTPSSSATAEWDKMAQGSDLGNLSGLTAGDTFYYNGTDFVRLGIGTAGQVLKVNSGATAPEWGVGSNASHEVVQMHRNTVLQPGTWAVPHSFGWAPNLYTNFTPLYSNSKIELRAHFSFDSGDTGSIGTGVVALSNTDGSSRADEYYFNYSGHSYYGGHSQLIHYMRDSWGTSAKRFGVLLGKHSSGYDIRMNRKTWGSPSDPGGTTARNDDRSVQLIIMEWAVV